MSMKILAGDGLRLGKHDLTYVMMGFLYLKKDKGWRKKHQYHISEIKSVQIIDEENFRTFGATAGWGLVGIALAGPFGAALGSYFGGKKNNITAAFEMDDGLKFLAECKPGTFRKLTKDYKSRQILTDAGLGKD